VRLRPVIRALGIPVGIMRPVVTMELLHRVPGLTFATRQGRHEGDRPAGDPGSCCHATASNTDCRPSNRFRLIDGGPGGRVAPE